MADLYGEPGLYVYEAAHYARGEAWAEAEAILSWFGTKGSRLLDLGCSAGLHALEFARRGFRVTGVDLEPAAIERARRRSAEERLPADFRVLDIARGPLAPLGNFDLVYSIGNVLSHLPKARIGAVFDEIAALLGEGGFLAFDLMLNDSRLPPTYLEEATNILWKRRLDKATGRLLLEGDFLDFAFTQNFDLWAYSAQEAATLLEGSGFSSIAVSTSLAFDHPYNPSIPAACAKFRARRGRP